MKRKSILLFLLPIICLIFSSCEKNSGTAPMQNSLAGNIQNGGYALKCENGYYYANSEDNSNLYKYDAEKKSSIKLAGAHYYYEMSLVGDKIYYISGSPGAVWSISPDGTANKRIINKRVGNLIIYKGQMYYRLSEDNNWGKLYTADLNGKNKKLLSNKVSHFCIYDDIIYYGDISNAGDENLSYMSIDGTDKGIINASYIGEVFVENDRLFYSDNNRNGMIFSYDLHTKEEICICQDKCWNLNCDNEWIYYRNQTEGGSLYRIGLDGASKEKLLDGNISDIVVIDKRIFYRNIDNDNKIEYIINE